MLMKINEDDNIVSVAKTKHEDDDVEDDKKEGLESNEMIDDSNDVSADNREGTPEKEDKDI